MNYIRRIYASIFKWAPVSAIFTILHYLSGAFVPAIITVVSVGLFDSAARVLNGERAQSKLYLYALFYLLIYLINDLLHYVFSIALNAGVYEKGTACFRIALCEKLSRLPLITFENADILNKKERAEKAVNDETLPAIFNRTLAFLCSAAAVISVASVLSRYSIWLLPLSLLSVLPYLFARLVRGKEFYYIKSIQAKKARRLSYLWELFTTRQTAKEMRVMGFDSYITDKWRATRDEMNEELWAAQKKDVVSLLMCDAIRIIGYGISVAAVLWLVMRGQVSLGVFGASITAFLSLQNSMRSFLIDLGRIPEQLAYAGDYYLFLDMPEEADGEAIFPGLRESITLKGIRFKYPNRKDYALKSINLTIHKGEKIVILGENGSGKTTLSKILLGLYPPESGRLLYDGKPAHIFSRESLYSNVTAIAQDFVAYHLTLRENVALSDITRVNHDGEILSALSLAGAESLGGLDDRMGREFGGRELSDGQWQKLAIARGLFRDSGMILLDEPTSALDPLIETEILTKFMKAAKGKTALIISHRVGLCKLADRIVVMKNGGIAEIGTHDDLMQMNGEYARLYRAQEVWYRT
mgnify:CR=1 FL=1